jgi:alpha-amylase
MPLIKCPLTQGVDGFRIDAADHIAKPFWTGFQQAANVYTVGEVFSKDISYTCNYASNALSGVMNYPMFVFATFSTTS